MKRALTWELQEDDGYSSRRVVSIYCCDLIKHFGQPGAVIPPLRLARRSDKNSPGEKRVGAKVRVCPSWWSSVDCTSTI